MSAGDEGRLGGGKVAPAVCHNAHPFCGLSAVEECGNERTCGHHETAAVMRTMMMMKKQNAGNDDMTSTVCGAD